jgi:hypothetical protein
MIYELQLLYITVKMHDKSYFLIVFEIHDCLQRVYILLYIITNNI